MNDTVTNRFAKPRLQVALAGAGMISDHHLCGWRKRADAAVVAIVDPDPARAEHKAKQFDVPRCYRDMQAMLASEAIDAVDIAAPREAHASLLELALERDIAVLCQKPFLPSYAEARRFVATARPSARVMVNQNFRFRPWYQQAYSWVRDGVLGELTGLTISCRSSGLLPDARGLLPYIERQPFVRTEKRLLIEEVLIHRIDVARWIAGELRLVGAQTRRSVPELQGESEASLLLAVAATGVPVAVDGNLASFGYPAAPAQDRVEIIGTRGRVMLDRDRLQLFGAGLQEIRYDHAQSYQASFDATIAHFVERLRDGQPFLTTPEDNLATLELVELAYEASATQRNP